MTSNVLILKPSNVLDKIKAIKAVRGLTGLGLKDSKIAVDNACYGKEETLEMHTPVNEPLFASMIHNLRQSGMVAHVLHSSDPVRKALKEEIQKLAVYATTADQYDIAQALITLLETHYPPEYVDSNDPVLSGCDEDDVLDE